MTTKADLYSDYSQVPTELKQRRQWVCHRNKIPYNACTGKHASSTDPTTWSTFEAACTAYLDRTNNFSGIGYVFSKDDPYIGVDMDKCRDKATGEVLAWAQTYKALLNSYTELSPSETGFHVFVRADLLLERHKLDHVEMYEKERYFTVTGRHVDGTPFTIEERTSELQKMDDMVFHAKTEQNIPLLNYIPLIPSDDEINSAASPAQEKNNVPLQGYTPLTPTDSEIASIAFPARREINAPHQSHTPIMSSDNDDEIIRLIRNTRQSGKFEALWLGDTSSYRGDESRADLALCSLLAFYCGPGAQMQVDRLFQRSGLMRPKWNQQRGNQTYGQRTTEGARFNVGQVKLITGGDVINARGLYENNRTFKPTHTVLLLTNHKPHADSSDRAFWERVKLISFNLRFVENPTQNNERTIDDELDEALEGEKSGILAWLVRGCIEYQAQGLSTPRCVVAATSEYHRQEDVIGQFLEEECTEGDRYKAEAKRLYETYSTWSKSQNVYPMSGKAFARRMERRFDRKRTKHGNLYIGVGIVDKDLSDGELDLDDTPLP